MIEGLSLALGLLSIEKDNHEMLKFQLSVFLMNRISKQALEKNTDSAFVKVRDMLNGLDLKAETLAIHLILKNPLVDKKSSIYQLSYRINKKIRFNSEETHKLAVKIANDFYGFEIE